MTSSEETNAIGEVVLVMVKEEIMTPDGEPLACAEDPLATAEQVPCTDPLSCGGMQYAFTFDSVLPKVPKDDPTSLSCSSSPEPTQRAKDGSADLPKRSKQKTYKAHFCHVCGFNAGRPYRLKIHMNIHTGEKPYHCDLCDYRTGDPQQLKLHKMTHSGETRYACDLCDFKAIQSRQLKNHMAYHTGPAPERTFICNICGYKADKQQRKKRHMFTHTGERPYACGTCDYKAAQGSALKTHMRLKHLKTHKKIRNRIVKISEEG